MTRQATPRRAAWATRIPGVWRLAGTFGRLASWRVGRIPAGLLALLPVALFIDLFDVGDELVFGPLGMAASFVVESAFLLAVTGRASYAIGFAGIDLVPGIDIVPFATITLVVEIARAWRAPEQDGKVHPEGVVIDV